jgi:hypothetical protein
VGGGAGGAIGNAYGDDDDRYRGDRRYRDSHYYGPPGKAKGHYKHRHKHH